MIECLRGKEIIDIAAGGAHSACITSNGELYTWGKGRYGRLGHGDSEDQARPKMVMACPWFSFIFCYLFHNSQFLMSSHGIFNYSIIISEVFVVTLVNFNSFQPPMFEFNLASFHFAS